MKNLLKLLVAFVFFFILIFPRPVLGVSCTLPSSGASPEEIQSIINECSRLADESHQQILTLSQQINLMDNQIKIAMLKISQTEAKIKVLEQEILALSGKIVRLDSSLNFLSKVLLSRVEENYKAKKISGLTLLFSAKNFSNFILRYRFLQTAQVHDRELLVSMEQTRTSYDEQKSLKEKAQADLEKLNTQLVAQRKQLAVQVEDKKRLLEETKGKESNYQKMLAAARSELEAILGILEGRGSEKEIRKVSEGERIASMISGTSCNSGGTHLHFIISRDGNTQNPFSFLKGGIDYENCSGGICGSGNGDPFNPSGSFSWPISPKITLTQGYGDTWAIHHTWVGRIYSFHNGIDIVSDSLEVKAVAPGTLFAGSYNGSCSLKYVRVQSNDNIDTYYLHVNF